MPLDGSPITQVTKDDKQYEQANTSLIPAARTAGAPSTVAKTSGKPDKKKKGGFLRSIFCCFIPAATEETKYPYNLPRPPEIPQYLLPPQIQRETGKKDTCIRPR